MSDDKDIVMGTDDPPKGHPPATVVQAIEECRQGVEQASRPSAAQDSSTLAWMMGHVPYIGEDYSPSFNQGASAYRSFSGTMPSSSRSRGKAHDKLVAFFY